MILIIHYIFCMNPFHSFSLSVFIRYLWCYYQRSYELECVVAWIINLYAILNVSM